MGIVPFAEVARVRWVVSAEERLRRLEEAKAFLRVHLAAEPQSARVVLSAARAAGIVTRTLHRAKAALRVQVQREGWGGQGQWMWLSLSLSRQREKQKAVNDAAKNTARITAARP